VTAITFERDLHHSRLAVTIAVTIGQHKNRMDIAVRECAVSDNPTRIIDAKRLDGREVRSR
jgi:hypothetical protein